MSKPQRSVENEPGKQYWLLITSRGHWIHLQKQGFWTFACAKKHDKVKTGDIGVVYMTANPGRCDSAIGGEIEFTGAPTIIGKTDTLFDAFYPARIPVKVRKTFDPPILFKPLAQKVSFVANAKNYGRSLQGQPIKSITVGDYQTLVGEK